MSKPLKKESMGVARVRRINDELAEKVRAYPIRLASTICAARILPRFTAQRSERKASQVCKGWVLKFKLLLETEPGGFKLTKKARVHLSHASKVRRVEKPPLNCFSLSSGKRFGDQVFEEPDFVSA